MPLHCWNQSTFKRVDELWGSFEALGENAFCSKNYEKVTILITTYQVDAINETIDVEVGNLVSKVRIKELGFSDDSPVLQATRTKSPLRMHSDKEESFSGSSFEATKIQSPARSDRSWTQVEEEALEAIYLGKENITEDVMSWEDGGRHMGEADILGINPIKGSTVNEEALKEDGLTVEDK
ncbi:hypothetical protein V6N13_071156 [Hibiscus sabdariffa]